MITECKNEKLKMLPKEVLISLKNFLNDESRYNLLESQLKVTGLILEKDNFQIPLHSVDDLCEIKSFLKEIRI